MTTYQKGYIVCIASFLSFTRVVTQQWLSRLSSLVGYLQRCRFWNAETCCEQLVCTNKSLIKKCQWLSIEKALFCSTILQDLTAQDKHRKNIMDCGMRYCLTHHTRPMLYHRTSIHSDRFSIFGQKICKFGWYPKCHLYIYLTQK